LILSDADDILRRTVRWSDCNRCANQNKEKPVETIGFIGSGNMAEALIKGILTAGVYAPRDVFISDIRKERLEELAGKYGVVVAGTNVHLAQRSETIVLSVKPQTMACALDSIKDTDIGGKLVISIAAGVKVAKIAAALGDVAIVRVMPNTPALIGQGASALYANDRAKPQLGQALSIFSAVGKTVVVEEEDLIDAVTAVSGSGPAYFFLLMEAMTQAGAALGLPADIAGELVLQTAKGASLLAVEARQNDESPAVLRRKVTSPGGTTEAALRVFAEAGFEPLVARALTAARDRSRELSR
jgi:pyrroline-5-carboxylate reductase